jgi:phosphotransferase system enzyme I (PtsP)
VTLCGELAGKPISAMALIGIGFRSISMSPASIGPVKAMLRELPLNELEAFFADNLDAPSARTPLRALLQAFADDRGIPL